MYLFLNTNSYIFLWCNQIISITDSCVFHDPKSCELNKILAWAGRMMSQYSSSRATAPIHGWSVVFLSGVNFKNTIIDHVITNNCCVWRNQPIIFYFLYFVLCFVRSYARIFPQTNICHATKQDMLEPNISFVVNQNELYVHQPPTWPWTGWVTIKLCRLFTWLWAYIYMFHGTALQIS